MTFAGDALMKKTSLTRPEYANGSDSGRLRGSLNPEMVVLSELAFIDRNAAIASAVASVGLAGGLLNESSCHQPA